MPFSEGVSEGVDRGIGADIKLGADCVGLLPVWLSVVDTFVQSADFDGVGQVEELGEFVDVVELIPLDVGEFLHKINPVFEEVFNQLRLLAEFGVRQKSGDGIDAFKYFVHQILQPFDFYTQFICSFALEQVHGGVGDHRLDQQLQEGVKVYDGRLDPSGVLPPEAVGVGFLQVDKMHQVIQLVLNAIQLGDLAFRNGPTLRIPQEALELNINLSQGGANLNRPIYISQNMTNFMHSYSLQNRARTFGFGYRKNESQQANHN